MRRSTSSRSISRSQLPETEADGYLNELDDAKWKSFKPDKDGCKLACDERVAATGGAEAHPAQPDRPFPALKLLEGALASLPAETKLIVAVMPPHVSTQPNNANERADLDLCKRRIAAIATHSHGYAIDFDIASAWTNNADNYWDASHFRTAIASAFMLRIKGWWCGAATPRTACIVIWQDLALRPRLRVSQCRHPPINALPGRTSALGH